MANHTLSRKHSCQRVSFSSDFEFIFTALVNTFVATYRVFSSAENMVKTLYNHYNRGLEKTHRAQIIKAVFQLVMKILPDLT